jgi:hypothetical protein
MAKRKLKKEQSKSTKSTENQKTKATGLGDSVEKVFQATGIDKVAKFILGEDCGCSERKEALNRIFPYKRAKCLTEDEYNYIKKSVDDKKRRFTSDEQQYFIKIWERIFSKKIIGCTSCSFYKELYIDLLKVYEEYKDE